MKRLLILFSLTLPSLAGCEKTYNAPAEIPPVQMQANRSIKELKAMYRSGATMVNDKEAVIAGKVISTDKYGNFYRTFYIQDETSGIEIKIGKTTLYNTYKIGQTVYLKPYHLCLGDYGSMISIGLPSADASYQNTWMDAPQLINSVLFRGEQGTPPAPTVITGSADLTDDRKGTWITIREATFKSGNMLTWAKRNDPNTPEDEAAYGEHVFTLSGGGEVTVRTSGYAKFADTPVPFTAGAKVNITGVLTQYNGTWQVVLNTDKDVAVLK